MEDMQKSTSIAKDIEKHPGDGSWGGSANNFDFKDSNDDNVQYQYKCAGENPSDPYIKSGDHDPSHVATPDADMLDEKRSGYCSMHSDEKYDPNRPIDSTDMLGIKPERGARGNYYYNEYGPNVKDANVI